MTMNKLLIYIVVSAGLFLSACKQNTEKQSVSFEPEKVSGKGTLVIIGGGERTDDIMKTIIHYGGGENARVLVVPFASGEADIVAPHQRDQFLSLGCKSADYLICGRDEVDKEENLRKLDSVTVVFFSGGDQLRLVNHLEGTKFMARIREIYDKGGVVSGTSAGAAVMSKVMITGEQRSVPSAESPFDKIEKGDVVTSQGFGFLKNIIIDQHFLIRKRQNRLFSVLKDYPAFRGIGIDESTAIVVKPDNTIDVVGESQVLIFEPVYQSPNELNEFVIKILKQGDSYRL